MVAITGVADLTTFEAAILPCRAGQRAGGGHVVVGVHLDRDGHCDHGLGVDPDKVFRRGHGGGDDNGGRLGHRRGGGHGGGRLQPDDWPANKT
jgi:hypothetical protein